jgi:hypothetical protein
LFLYEMIWNLIGIALLLAIERRVVRRDQALLADGGTPGAGLRWGRMFGLYLIWYGLGRSWLETIRIDPTSDAPLGVPANVWTSGIAILLGIAIVVVQGRRHPEPEPSVYQPGREPEDEDGDVDGGEDAEPEKDAEPAGSADDDGSASTASDDATSEGAASKAADSKSPASENPATAEPAEANGSSDSK